MCEANAFMLNAGGETEIMKDVEVMEVHGDEITFRDLLGQGKKVKGRVKLVDIGHHKITVEPLTR